MVDGSSLMTVNILNERAISNAYRTLAEADAQFTQELISQYGRDFQAYRHMSGNDMPLTAFARKRYHEAHAKVAVALETAYSHRKGTSK